MQHNYYYIIIVTNIHSDNYSVKLLVAMVCVSQKVFQCIFMCLLLSVNLLLY